MYKFSAIIIATFLTFNILSAQESFTPYPFKKEVEAKSNVAGDVEQSVSTYTMMFALSPRCLE